MEKAKSVTALAFAAEGALDAYDAGKPLLGPMGRLRIALQAVLADAAAIMEREQAKEGGHAG